MGISYAHSSCSQKVKSVPSSLRSRSWISLASLIKPPWPNLSERATAGLPRFRNKQQLTANLLTGHSGAWNCYS